VATASELKLRQADVETVRAAKTVVAAKRTGQDEEGAKARDIANELGLDKSTT